MSPTKAPFFTIIIPCLNEEKHLPQLLHDLAQQTFTDFAVVVVDGKSQDKTVAKAESFASKLPLTVIHATKRHVSYQRNLGAKATKSPWLIFMDADNRLPRYFLQGVKFRIEESKPKICTFYVAPDSKNRQDYLICHLSNLYIDLQKNTSNAYVLESMMVFRQDIFKKLHGFSDQVLWGEGNELLRRAYKQNITLTVCKTPVYTYSTRRLKKEGTLKLARNIAVQEFHRVLKIPVDKQLAKKLYPMEGGKWFEKNISEQGPLLQLLANFSNPKKFRQDLTDLLTKQIKLSATLEPLANLLNGQSKPKK
jgi:glycosyltransferase involved in cell wall biosynthesis